MSQVTADLLRRLGMPVEYVAADWATVVRRRANREPPERGGWNIFHTTANSGVFINPATHLAVRATGAAAWPGWPEDAALEAAVAAWFAAGDEAARRSAASRIEAEAFRVVPYAPLGQFRSTSAWRRNITGVLPVGRPVAWNVRRA
jgi:peptide/nickel transport system substrate-binding protein